MSSPFAVFRRHQRVMLATVGMLAMIAFVFLPNISSTMSSRSRQDPIVVDTAHYGELHESDLANINANRELARNFLSRLADALVLPFVEQLQVQPGLRDFYLRQFGFEKRAQLLQIMNVSGEQIENLGKRLGDEPAVETFVLAKDAEAAGIVVSDATINDYLSKIIDNALTKDQVKELIASLGGGRSQVSQKQLFQALRTELLAFEYRRIFATDLQAVTPGQRWDYFTRINLRATIEALAIPVESFVSQVAEPSEQELRALYTQHKSELPIPESPDPGFKEPMKIVAQYFMANAEEFIRRAEGEVTDEQVAEYYEKNKRQFRKLALTPDKDGKKDDADGETKPPSDDAKPPADDATKPADDAPSADGNQPSASETQPATDGKAAPADATKPTPPAAPQKNGKSADGRSSSIIRLVNADQKAAPAANAASPAAAPPSAAKPAAAPDAKPAEPAAKPTGDAPAAKSAEADAKPTDDASAAKPADADAKPADGDAKPEAPIEYEPLEKVKGDIRNSIAREKAGVELRTTMDALEKIMIDYYDERAISDELQLDAEANAKDLGAKEAGAKDAEAGVKEGKATAKKPAGPKPLDFEALAKQHGVEAHEMGPLSMREAHADTSIGRSSPAAADLRGQNFLSLMYSDGIPLYKPLRTSDTRREFLSWKTRVEPEHTPTFEQAKPKVERAWKLIAARELAKKKAKEYMTKAQRDKQSLETLFGKTAELQVLKPAQFSWITFGAVPRDNDQPQPRLDTVEGIEMAGEGFMRSVFRLNPGEFDLAENNPQTMVYVVHLLSYDRSLESLLASFGEDKDPRRIMALANRDQSQIFRNWVQGLMLDAGVQWRRSPTEASRRRDVSDEE